jgi:hypothetical protein
MPFEGAAAIMWCKGIHHFSFGKHYKACCILGIADTPEEAVAAAEQIEDGERMPPEEGDNNA